MVLRSIAKPWPRAAGLLIAALLVAGASWADGTPAPEKPQKPAGRLMADWPQKLSEAGCPVVPGKSDERRCSSRDSFAVCKEAVDSGHLHRCHLADSHETYPARK
jgi:hypothetical protein